MFLNHITRELSAYHHGELSPQDSRAVAEHLIGCQRCRAEFEQIKLGARFAESLPQLQAPESLWKDLEGLIEAQTGNNGSSRTSSSRVSWSFFQPRFAAIAAALILAFGLGGFFLYMRASRPSWEVARLDGAPRIGSTRINDKSRLGIGQWLETDGVSRAQISVGSIGQVEIDPNTKVRLLQTLPTEHRLELARGRMSARIWAPPRLFFVDTPSAVAADLGCAYTLEVDDNGGSLLRVTSGWVALELKDRESIVPAGAACATRPGIGPGTPYFEDASEIFRKALSKLDFEPRDTEWSKIPSLNLVLMESRGRDTLTLWHLLSRVQGDDRVLVYERLAALAPPPNGVTREGIVQLDSQMLTLWKDNLEHTWSNESLPGVRKVWKKVWTTGLGKMRELEGKK
ncbi:MAG: zf-HC2 domain-containing protein [Pyrinomonadaceae bacterium]